VVRKQQPKSYSLRISNKLREWIQRRANYAGRSLNSELNQMLKRDKERQEEEHMKIT